MKLFKIKSTTYYIKGSALFLAVVEFFVFSVYWWLLNNCNDGLFFVEFITIVWSFVATMILYVYLKAGDGNFTYIYKDNWDYIRNQYIEVRIRNAQMETLKLINKDNAGECEEFIYKAIKYKLEKAYSKEAD